LGLGYSGGKSGTTARDCFEGITQRGRTIYKRNDPVEAERMKG
jgi:hypothetical protein